MDSETPRANHQLFLDLGNATPTPILAIVGVCMTFDANCSKKNTEHNHKQQANETLKTAWEWETRRQFTNEFSCVFSTGSFKQFVDLLAPPPMPSGLEALVFAAVVTKEVQQSFHHPRASRFSRMHPAEVGCGHPPNIASFQWHSPRGTNSP